MAQEELKETYLEKNPSFIVERGNVFRVVDTLFEGMNKWDYSYKEELTLELGLDIREEPTRCLALLVESGIECECRSVIAELRKFCQVAGCDYFSYEPIQGYITRCLFKDNFRGFYEVRPRLFRKIPV